ncbi:hypothetical protein LO80_08485 [Candidatus Francisella endociliophora]|uniref:Uncharacterized protein n=1 Tax=Candidatus Francisella endociliophora TaxID=653937 RepID=A0A097ER36_9GAMM|nr:hypothetical protein [Francisella sp. FSC1006]AIT10002.1 hypothetical protein LO80_08485 [Francisella sp. FSC1006]
MLLNINQLIYNVTLASPNYNNGSEQNYIISNDNVATISRSIVSQQIESGDLPVTAAISLDDNKQVNFSFALKEYDLNLADTYYNALNNQFDKNQTVTATIKNWKDAIAEQLNINSDSIEKYNKLISNDYKYLKNLSTQKDLSGMPAQTLLASYLSRIDNYQQHVYSLEKTQKNLEMQLKSANESLSKIGGFTIDKKNKQNVIIVGGVVFAFILGCLAVMLKVFVTNTIRQPKAES